ncbi:MAG: hypothetical protein GY915_06370 [bacterium]|nr:hypothetical protein [bacterium]
MNNKIILGLFSVCVGLPNITQASYTETEAETDSLPTIVLKLEKRERPPEDDGVNLGQPKKKRIRRNSENDESPYLKPYDSSFFAEGEDEGAYKPLFYIDEDGVLHHPELTYPSEPDVRPGSLSIPSVTALFSNIEEIRDINENGHPINSLPFPLDYQDRQDYLNYQDGQDYLRFKKPSF